MSTYHFYPECAACLALGVHTDAVGGGIDDPWWCDAHEGTTADQVAAIRKEDER